MAHPTAQPDPESSPNPAPKKGAFMPCVLTRIVVLSMRQGTDGSALAFADVELDYASAGRQRIFGCTVMEGDKGLWVSFPRRKGKDDKYRDIVRFEGRMVQFVADAILAEYRAQFDPGSEVA